MPVLESGNRGGTLTVHFAGISTPEAGVTVRITTATPEGRAGLAYSGVPSWRLLTAPCYLGGLRQNGTDRSNVAIQNAGTPTQGDIWLRLTVFSGDPATAISMSLLDQKLFPGEFRQFNGILHSNGLSLANGYVRVERIKGTAPYYAYAVINDQANSDGSFIPPVPESGSGLTLPVVVEAGSFTSEVILTNWSTKPKSVHFKYVSGAVDNPVSRDDFFSIDLAAGEQSIIPDFVQHHRDLGVPDIGPQGMLYAGALFAGYNRGEANGLFLAARTSRLGGGGRYGSFYIGVPYASGPTQASSIWLYGLQQNDLNRSNLALLNSSSIETNLFNIELFDGETGSKVNSLEGINLDPLQWMQFNSILSNYAPGTTQGYARVTRKGAFGPFVSYAIVNDGGKPGQRTRDGAFITSSP